MTPEKKGRGGNARQGLGKQWEFIDQRSFSVMQISLPNRNAMGDQTSLFEL